MSQIFIDLNNILMEEQWIFCVLQNSHDLIQIKSQSIMILSIRLDQIIAFQFLFRQEIFLLSSYFIDSALQQAYLIYLEFNRVFMRITDDVSYNILFGQAVQTFLRDCSIMDNQKTHDTQLNNRNKFSISAFLARKGSFTRSRKPSLDSVDTDIVEEKSDKSLPIYSFAITNYEVGEYVKYTVELQQEFSILKRKITRKYKFYTRYSQLEKLDEKLGNIGLPPKRWFGNKKQEFLQKRKVQLENYLNKAAGNRKLPFLKFVKQIKDSVFNIELKQPFSIE